MKNDLLTLFVFPVSLFISSVFFVKNESKKQAFNQEFPGCDTLSRIELFKKTSEGIEKMKASDIFSDEETISIIRVYNSLHFVNIARDKTDSILIEEFRNKFDKNFFPSVFTRIETTYGKGMTFYSKKYDLFIGPAMELRCRDVYIINK
jgi:hypothetical protein